MHRSFNWKTYGKLTISRDVIFKENKNDSFNSSNHSEPMLINESMENINMEAADNREEEQIEVQPNNSYKEEEDDTVTTQEDPDDDVDYEPDEGTGHEREVEPRTTRSTTRYLGSFNLLNFAFFVEPKTAEEANRSDEAEQ